MAPFLTISSYKIAKKFNAKFIYEVKDIWPLSIIELGNISPSHPLIKMMNWCEKFAINRADYIVSSLQNYDKHLKNDLNINKEFFWINNGIDLDEMRSIEGLPQDVKNQVPKNKFIVGYTGTIGIQMLLNIYLKVQNYYNIIIYIL